jgi:RecJ-like exonuclease
MSTKHTDCPECQGEGYLLTFKTGFSSRYETFEESESFEGCKLCKGEGFLEVCAICLQPFKVVQGIEVCGCAAVTLPKAA